MDILRMRIILTIFLVFASNCILAQVSSSDTSVILKYNKVTYSPRVVLGIERSVFAEFGICRRWSYRFDDYSKQKGYNPRDAAGYFGAFISNEIVLSNQEVIFGPKLGFETVLIGGASLGILFSLEATDYFYRANQYFAITPKFILPLSKQCTPLAFLSYGYNFNSFESLSAIIGNHKFSFILNLCFKEHKKINQMYKDFNLEIDRINAIK